ncbi:MAG: peptidoglycan DD-metalloendopeptidase family protein [Betaproteobacteria bacterium]|nr:peptidoglycan DD-metalloendopeptidase family protein [Betaproteobacteria bacterium]
MSLQSLTRRAAFLLGALVLAAGCATRSPAPVVERAPPPPPKAEPPKPAPPKPVAKPVATHTIKRGETLVGIALQYGLDYRELAAWNGIANPNVISVGQVLVLAAPPGADAAPAATVATPLAGTAPVTEARPLGNTDKLKVEPRGQRLPYSDKALAQLSAGDAAGEPPAPPAQPVAPAQPAAVPSEPERPAAGTQGETVDWIWPVKGKVLSAFTEASKGIDIAGRKGTPVVAAAAGRVVYAGQGLRGYGKLVIIKHNDTWLSAYAHNDNIVVKEQQDVKRGQKIAEMGATDSDQVKLHFEVRRQGKPVDPARVLPAP